ncbi:uncharacterized protein TNCV_874751 [Trichonephila clavipes]|nr:uncharacterized protein TNCV_874751 [Trichonephila clavipes]
MRNARGFIVWPEVYFSGSANVTEFLEGIDNQTKLLEIPSDLSCAYLKGHLMGRALDWYQIFGSTLVQNTATDFPQLKAALSKAFPAIQKKKGFGDPVLRVSAKTEPGADRFCLRFAKATYEIRTGDF